MVYTGIPWYTQYNMAHLEEWWPILRFRSTTYSDKAVSDVVGFGFYGFFCDLTRPQISLGEPPRHHPRFQMTVSQVMLNHDENQPNLWVVKRHSARYPGNLSRVEFTGHVRKHCVKFSDHQHIFAWVCDETRDTPTLQFWCHSLDGHGSCIGKKSPIVWWCSQRLN